MEENDLKQFVHNKAVDAIVALDSGRWDRIRQILCEIRDETADALNNVTAELPDARDYGEPVG